MFLSLGSRTSRWIRSRGMRRTCVLLRALSIRSLLLKTRSRQRAIRWYLCTCCHLWAASACCIGPGLCGTSENFPSETVWKIAGRPLEGALLAPGGANRLLFAPSWRPYSPRYGTHSEFPNSFSRDCLENSWQGRIGYFLVVQNVQEGAFSLRRLERVMNSIRNGLGMRETEIARETSRPWNPHFYAIFAQVHNTL